MSASVVVVAVTILGSSEATADDDVAAWTFLAGERWRNTSDNRGAQTVRWRRVRRVGAGARVGSCRCRTDECDDSAVFLVVRKQAVRPATGIGISLTELDIFIVAPLLVVPLASVIDDLITTAASGLREAIVPRSPSLSNFVDLR